MSSFKEKLLFVAMAAIGVCLTLYVNGVIG